MKNTIYPLIIFFWVLVTINCGNDNKKTIRILIPEDFQSEDFQREGDIKLTKKINKFSQTWAVKKALNLYYNEWQDKIKSYEYDLSKVRVSDSQYSWINEIIINCSKALNIDPPIAYIINNSSPDIYLRCVNKPILIIHSSTIELLNINEIFFLISRELIHIKCNHLLTYDIVYNCLYFVESMPFKVTELVLSNIILITFLNWIREAEITADFGGLILCNDPQIAVNALLKLKSGLKYEIDLDEFLKQENNFESDKFIPRKIPILFKEVMSPQPFVITRIKELLNYSKSDKYNDQGIHVDLMGWDVGGAST